MVVGTEVMAAHLEAISAYGCGIWQDAVKVAQQVRLHSAGRGPDEPGRWEERAK